MLFRTALCAAAAMLCAAFAQPGGDEAKRAQELKIPEIERALNLKAGSHVADIGAGDGFYDAVFSQVVGGSGRVYAEDIDEGAIKRLHERVDKDHLSNVEVVTGTPSDPKLPGGELDGVLMVITYHEIADHEAMLRRVMAALKPGGRYVIVDMTPHKTLTRPRADQTKNHVIAPDIVEREVGQAGFQLISRIDRFIDNPDEESTRWMMVWQKP
jgi:predicted methyltransferase